jgi:hypothetical protein
MTDITTPAPERPFDPGVVARLQARIDKRDLWGIEADVHEILRQLAYAKTSRHELAEDCRNWRGRYEETRGRLEAVRSLAKEWCAYAEARTQDNPTAAFAAGNALGQLLRVLDGESAT